MTTDNGQRKKISSNDSLAIASPRNARSLVLGRLLLILAFPASFLRRYSVALAVATALLFASMAYAGDDLLDRWFAAQAEIQTWSARFTQTRTLKALKEPLTADGRVWFAAPNQFRWELGSPARTIAIRETNALVILYPKLRRAERYSLNNHAPGPWRDALTLLEAGFPRNRELLEKQFEIKSQNEHEERVELVMQPRSAAARKLITEVRVIFNRADLLLQATELHFADGSSLRNDFHDSLVNPVIDAARFRSAIPDDYKVTEPLAAASK